MGGFFWMSRERMSAPNTRKVGTSLRKETIHDLVLVVESGPFLEGRTLTGSAPVWAMTSSRMTEAKSTDSP